MDNEDFFAAALALARRHPEHDYSKAFLAAYELDCPDMELCMKLADKLIIELIEVD